MRDLKAALSSFIVMVSEATRVSLHVLLVARSIMLHVLSATRAARFACACRYCCWVLHTATRRCWRLSDIKVDASEPFANAEASRCGAGSTWSATLGTPRLVV